MNLQQLEQELSQSLNDLKLDNQEKIYFRNLTDNLSDDKIRFIRNKAFYLASPYIMDGGEVAVRVLIWLERVIKLTQPVVVQNKIRSSAWFSPGDECLKQIIHLIRQARQSLKICVFTISDNRLTEAILNAQQRKININIISDNDKANDRGSDIDYLSSQGVSVHLDHSPYHMHHKFMIVDNRILLNGSFNWTRSASEANEENILITDDSNLVKQYSDKFDELLTTMNSVSN